MTEITSIERTTWEDFKHQLTGEIAELKGLGPGADPDTGEPYTNSVGLILAVLAANRGAVFFLQPGNALRDAESGWFIQRLGVTHVANGGAFGGVGYNHGDPNASPPVPGYWWVGEQVEGDPPPAGEATYLRGGGRLSFAALGDGTNQIRYSIRTLDLNETADSRPKWAEVGIRRHLRATPDKDSQSWDLFFETSVIANPNVGNVLRRLTWRMVGKRDGDVYYLELLDNEGNSVLQIGPNRLQLGASYRPTVTGSWADPGPAGAGRQLAAALAQLGLINDATI